MIIMRIFKIIARILEITIILALVLYPWVVLGQSPLTYYWNELKELWVIVQTWPIINKIVGLFT